MGKASSMANCPCYVRNPDLLRSLSRRTASGLASESAFKDVVLPDAFHCPSSSPRTREEHWPECVFECAQGMKVQHAISP